jgi:hypothetical protein
MTMPGFTAGHSLYKTSSRYRVVGAPSAGQEALAYPAQNEFLVVTPIGVIQPVPFTCGSLACTCDDTTRPGDCNDMFSTNVCGPYALCEDLPGGGSRCICLRSFK